MLVVRNNTVTRQCIHSNSGNKYEYLYIIPSRTFPTNLFIPKTTELKQHCDCDNIDETITLIAEIMTYKLAYT